MGNIAVHEFISLDGVIEDPRWTADYPFDPRMGQAIAGIMGASGALLLGRRTYEMFAPAWSGRTADQDPGAPFMNESTKYVVSGTLSSGDWSNSEILGPYSAETIRALKTRVDGKLGSGQRLFADGNGPVKLSLGGCEAYDSGVVHLTYAPAA